MYSSPAGKLVEILIPFWKGHRKFWALKDVSFHVKKGRPSA